MRTRRSQFSSDPASSGPSSNEPRATSAEHTPVLLHEVIRELAIRRDDIVVDATLGGAGHAREISHHLGNGGTLIGFDLDKDAIDRAGETLASAAHKTFLVEANFRSLSEELAKLRIGAIDKALFDLGWSSYQLSGERGFSFLTDEPLVMTYSKNTSPLTAREIVNRWEEQSLADIFFGWGEERYARRIAKAIALYRQKKPIETSRQLAEIVRAAVPAAYRRGRLHPATKTFQALRIAVNDELGSLVDGLSAAWRLLNPGGRIAVISFHSVEDRIVKRTFVEWEQAGEGKRMHRKPIPPTEEEIRENPRSRSAKLRVIEKKQ